jgi:glycosyltransferase involved in cell wall biosynthesis
MSRFAAELPVLYVEPWQRLRMLRRSPPGLPDLMEQWKTPGVVVREGGVRVFRSPPWLPVSGASRARRVTLGLWLRRVRSAARACGIRHPVLWVSHPEMVDVVGRMNEIFSVYHIVDEYSGYTGAGSLADLADREQELLDRVDLAIAVTPELVEARARNNRQLLLVENAVDYAQFRKAVRDAIEPVAMSSIPQPRYGYSGLIGVRLNFRLLLDFARASSERSLVLIGKVDPRGCEEALAELRELPNVHFLGEVPAAAVASHVAAFDVGLLPYAINRETQHISPLKLYEYLAAGKPVIATPIPAARRHEDMVVLAEDAPAFGAAGEALLAADDDAARARRSAFAATNTWDHRVRQIGAALQPQVAARATGELARAAGQ